MAEDREKGKLAGYLTGLTTDEECFFRINSSADADLSTPNGKNNMLLGLGVLPEYRGQGLARELMRRYLAREQAKGKKESNPYLCGW